MSTYKCINNLFIFVFCIKFVIKLIEINFNKFIKNIYKKNQIHIPNQI